MFDPTTTILLDCAGKATILVTGAAALHFTLRQASAAARHLLWTTTLACLLLLPVLSVIVPQKIIQTPTQLVTQIVVTPSATRTAPARTREAEPVNWILWIWAAGAALVMLRVLTGVARARWIQAGAEPVEVELLQEMQRQMRIGRTVRLLRSAAIKTPGDSHPGECHGMDDRPSACGSRARAGPHSTAGLDEPDALPNCLRALLVSSTSVVGGSSIATRTGACV